MHIYVLIGIDRYGHVCVYTYMHTGICIHACMHACIHEVQRCRYRYKSYTDTDHIHIHIHMHMQYAICNVQCAICNMQHTIHIQIHMHSCVCMYTKSHTHSLICFHFPGTHFEIIVLRMLLEQDLAKEISIRMPNGDKSSLPKSGSSGNVDVEAFAAVLAPCLNLAL